MKLRKGRVLLVIVIIGLIICVSYNIIKRNKKPKNGNANAEGTTVYEDSITLGVSNFDTMNPILTKNKDINNIDKLIFSPMFVIENNKLACVIAKEYAKTGEKTYIIKINNAINWSDGTKVSAKDVKYTIDIIKASNGIFYDNVKNISSVDAIDESTIKITLEKEEPFFEYNLIFPILSERYYNGEDFFSSDKVPIGTGMYKIETIGSNQIVLCKNENYNVKDSKNEHINKIYINLYSEVGEIYNSFKLGNVDIINTASGKYKDYIGTLGYYVKQYGGREYDFLCCNCDDYMMKDKSVRQAINCIIDKDNIISTVFNNDYYKSNYPLDFGCYLYSDDYISLTYNAENAKSILRRRRMEIYK